PGAGAGGVRGVGDARVRRAGRRLRVLRAQAGALRRRVAVLLPPHAGAGRAVGDRLVVAEAARVPEGDPVEHALRGDGLRRGERPAHWALPPAARRTWLDAGLYAAFVVAVARALAAPWLGDSELLPIAVVVPILGLADRTAFLALRAEHYWVTI